MAALVPTAAEAAVAVAAGSVGPDGPRFARCLASTFGILAVGLAGALLGAPAAAAAPDCVKTGPMTTQCETPGHTQIITSPPAMHDDSWYPYGGFVVGFPW